MLTFKNLGFSEKEADIFKKEGITADEIKEIIGEIKEIENVFINNTIKYVYEIGTKKLIRASLSKSFWSAL